MNIQEYTKVKQDLYLKIIEYLDTKDLDSNIDVNFENEEYEKNETKLFLEMINSIIINHIHGENFFDKINKLISNIDLKNFLTDKERKKFTKKLEDDTNEEICKQIRNDDIDDFQTYYNNLEAKKRKQGLIKINRYEHEYFSSTRMKATLIEYAIYYGAEKIVKFLIEKDPNCLEAQYFKMQQSDKLIEIFFDAMEKKKKENEKNKLIEYVEDNVYSLLVNAIKTHDNERINNLIDGYRVFLEKHNFQHVLDYLQKPENNDREYSVLNGFSGEMKEKVFNYLEGFFFKYYNYSHFEIKQFDMYRLFKLMANNYEKPFRIFLKTKPGIENFTDVDKERFIHTYSEHKKDLHPDKEINFFDFFEIRHTKKLFQGCTNITTIEIPDSITKIEKKAFYGCKSLTSIKFGEGSQLSCIGERAFRECLLLKSILIPENVKTIKEGAFSYCESITEIIIPSKVDEIGWSAFVECLSLGSVEIKSSQLTGIPRFCFKNCRKLTSVKLPQSVKMVDESAFEDCRMLATIDLSNVCHIDRNAFKNCRSFRGSYVGDSSFEVDLPNASYVGDSAFENCIAIKSIKFKQPNAQLGIAAFKKCTGLNSFIFPSNLEVIEWSLFEGCENLSGVKIPESVKQIGDNAFYGCQKLGEINIPETVKIGLNAFKKEEKSDNNNVE